MSAATEPSNPDSRSPAASSAPVPSLRAETDFERVEASGERCAIAIRALLLDTQSIDLGVGGAERLGRRSMLGVEVDLVVVESGDLRLQRGERTVRMVGALTGLDQRGVAAARSREYASRRDCARH